MKYSLFLLKIQKDVAKFSSAAVVIGALKVKSYSVLCSKGLREAILRSPWQM